MEKVESVFQNHLFEPPTIEEAAVQIRCSIQDVGKTVGLLVEHKRLVRVEQDLFFHAEAIKQARQRIIEHIHGEGQGRLESVKFKYLVDTTRKYALPLLDYMDKIGVTRRVGNTRYLK
jgi:selenocysteine-specific elongation factor